MLLVLSSLGNQDKLWLGGPLRLKYTDFALWRLNRSSGHTAFGSILFLSVVNDSTDNELCICLLTDNHAMLMICNAM